MSLGRLVENAGKAKTLLSAASTSLPDIESCVLVAGFTAVVTMGPASNHHIDGEGVEIT
jgi:hypothetical protein